MYVSSVTDSLTGLYNRRHFDSRFSVECLLARERKMILSLILFDIDHFKKVNDTYGHQTGDIVLKAVSGALKAVLRTSDIIARIGGEEFAVLLFDTSPKDAIVAAEKVRRAVEAMSIPVTGHDPLKVTLSAGIAGYLDARDTPASVFKSADESLYKAKASGRNQTICHSAE
jgi:diguanylate cyclase (GGDEF)-like protein